MEFLLSALAGVVGGIVIAVVGMIYRAATGGGLWSLPNNIGGIVMGAKAGDARSFGVVTLVGVGFHMVLSAMYGVATLVLARWFSLRFVVVGIAVGIAVWFLNHFVLGSVTDGIRKHVEFNPVWLAFLLHALYGLVTGVVATMLIR